MEKLNSPWLDKFRHELWLQHIEVIDEVTYKGSISFVLKDGILCSHEIEALMRIHSFNILNLYHDGNLRMHISCYDNI